MGDYGCKTRGKKKRQRADGGIFFALITMGKYNVRAGIFINSPSLLCLLPLLAKLHVIRNNFFGQQTIASFFN
jgi:hypothetical protein